MDIKVAQTHCDLSSFCLWEQVDIVSPHLCVATAAFHFAILVLYYGKKKKKVKKTLHVWKMKSRMI